MIFLEKLNQVVGCVPDPLEDFPARVICKDCAVRRICRYAGARIEKLEDEKK